ncbi:DUF1800 family protein [Duganella sp. FT80W]|uniref:DUF1800 family protein n=1 Tax=Duganella guangzhouensis TaxID=2666084 RepID=A0A6I2L3Y7_9BURK|nr:DUF1800 domain-containing protein [Duganella guangzhouensis]MRW92838.1 DUF1800 family protein [Duganella guangzhouensis]
MKIPARPLAVLLLLSGCAATTTTPPQPSGDPVALSAALNRVSWGVNTSTWQRAEKQGYERWLDQQLHPAPAKLPPEAQAQIDTMTISQKPVMQLVQELEAQRRDYDKAIADDEAKKAAQRAYQQELTRLAKEAATRSLLRDLYSPNQLQEQMTWFWMNHFNVHQGKSNLRALVGDYEEQAIRPHALGKFRDLLAATLHHPAMIRYLDNEQNAAGRINENYAREIMELHTLGVDGGYTQNDVQQLARILTGVGVNLGDKMPNVRKDKQAEYVRNGLFEFNPNRHDYGDKLFLGQPVKGRGLAEVDEALDRLARAPATARYVSHKLAVYFVADEPPPQLVQRMAERFQSSDGDIAAVLRVMFTSPEFTQSLGHKFKDPVHYVVSAVRLSYDDKIILNTGPMLNWLNRMGQPLYGRQTPDGYALTQPGWASPGQMTTRFEIAKAIGGGSAGLFKTEGAQPLEKPAFPQLANPLYYQSLQKSLAPATRQELDQAGSPQEWNTLLLSSPELMHR